MPILVPDELDDALVEAGSAGFADMNATTKATLLPDSTVQLAKNSLCATDGLVGQRPGMRYMVFLGGAASGTENAFQGAMFYTAADCQAVLALRKGAVSSVRTLTAESAVAAVMTGAASDRARWCQLVDRAFMADSDGGVKFAKWLTGTGTWETGQVIVFADTTAMPVFSTICTHGFRLLAAGKDSDEVFPSAILQGAAPADWSRTSSIRVGDGTADPIVTMLSGQDQYLLVLKDASVWRVDTSDSAAGNWSMARLTDKAGCAAAGSAVQIGQDTFFLSRQGVVSLSAMLTTDAISAASIISQPIETHLRRMNWGAVDQVVSAAWRQYYLLAVPLGNDTAPRDVFVFDVSTRRWVGHWTFALPDVPAVAQFAGIGGLLPVNFDGLTELVIADNCGRLWWLDEACTVDEVLRSSGIATTQEIVQDITTKAWDFGFPENQKSLLNLTVEFWDSTSGTAQIYLVRDGKDPEAVSGTIKASGNPGFPIGFPCRFQRDKGLKRAFSLRKFGRAREVAVRVAETTGALKLRGVRFSAFVDAAEVQQ